MTMVNSGLKGLNVVYIVARKVIMSSYITCNSGTLGQFNPLNNISMFSLSQSEPNDSAREPGID